MAFSLPYADPALPAVFRLREPDYVPPATQVKLQVNARSRVRGVKTSKEFSIATMHLEAAAADAGVRGTRAAPLRRYVAPRRREVQVGGAVRWFPPRREPRFFTDSPNRTYPERLPHRRARAATAARSRTRSPRRGGVARPGVVREVTLEMPSRRRPREVRMPLLKVRLRNGQPLTCSPGGRAR